MTRDIQDIHTDFYVVDRYPFLEQSQRDTDGLRQHIERYGQRIPIAVHLSGTDVQLLDGRRRLQALESLGYEAVEVQELPFDSLVDACVYRLRQDEFCIQSPIAQALAVFHVSVATAASSATSLTGLANWPTPINDHYLSQCKKIAALPLEMLVFLHQKKVSFSQCLQLANYPEAVFTALLPHRDALQLTASVMLELLDALVDVHRRYDWPFASIFDQDGLQGLFQLDISPSERTQRLRDYLRQLQYPTLARHNHALERLVADLPKPRDLALSWDRSLENREVRVSTRLRSTEDVVGLQEFLASDQTKTTIGNMLEQL